MAAVPKPTPTDIDFNPINVTLWLPDDINPAYVDWRALPEQTEVGHDISAK